MFGNLDKYGNYTKYISLASHDGTVCIYHKTYDALRGNCAFMQYASSECPNQHSLQRQHRLAVIQDQHRTSIYSQTCVKQAHKGNPKIVALDWICLIQIFSHLFGF